MTERRTAANLIRFHVDELARLAEAGQHPALAERARTALDRHWALVQGGACRTAGVAPEHPSGDGDYIERPSR